MRPAVLYITYDGILEPLGQSQVLSYLEGLTAKWEIHIISYEKRQDRGDVGRMESMRKRLTNAGIFWTPLAYHKSPSALATAYDIAVGTLIAILISLNKKVRIVHARSYVPALIALNVKGVTGAKFLFDMRGFWADERIDAALWPRDGLLYRVAKGLEKKFLQSADHIVTLTKASAQEIARFPYLKRRRLPLTVIPTCVDLNRFHPPEARMAEPLTLGYVGSVGTWYLFDDILAFFRALVSRRPDARMLIVNRDDHKNIRDALSRAGIDISRVEIVTADYGEVPAYIARMHAGAAVIKPSYSKIASAPTKLAEYLGCGVPCVGNVGVGDMEEHLGGRRVGVVMRDFSPSDQERAVDGLLSLLGEPDISQRCVKTARELFSLEVGVDSYNKIYTSLIRNG